ncbi:hypothetical protein LPJ73_004625, partial [Coemansia sp. RSA 2703]
MLAYRSALLNLQPLTTRNEISTDLAFSAFFRGLMSTVIRRIERDPVDVPLILANIQSVLLTDLSPSRLAQRVCWLLCVFGFLRPADFARVVADKIVFTDQYNHSKALSADQIGAVVRDLTRTGTNGRNTQASARSIGVDMALRNGADRDLVRTHGNWADNITVENHYQRSRLPASSMTAIILGDTALISNSSLASGQGEANVTPEQP